MPDGCPSGIRLVRGVPAPDDAKMTDAIGPDESEAGGILTIDLAAIVANWRALGRRASLTSGVTEDAEQSGTTEQQDQQQQCL